MVHGHVALGVNRGQLVLGGGGLVVLGLRGDAELPELGVQILHEGGDPQLQRAVIVVVQLLAFGRAGAEEGVAGVDEVLALFIAVAVHEEVFLLQTDRGVNAAAIRAENLQKAAGLRVQRVHAPQQRGFFVQRVAAVGAESRGDAEHAVLDEGVARGVPGRVAAGLKGGAQAAGGEGAAVGLALDELLAGELHQNAAAAVRREEALVLLGGVAGVGLEPVGIVRRTQLGGPGLHGVGHGAGGLDVHGRAGVHGALERGVDRLAQIAAHGLFIEDHAAEGFGKICHSYGLLKGEIS